MKNLKNITAQSLIIHITDKKVSFNASKAPSPLDPTARKYIEGHISDALKASAIRAARFQNPDADVPARLCRRIISGEHDFVEGSAYLAERLLLFTQPHYTRGDLAVVIFEAEQDLGEITTKHQFLALMKLELDDSFVNNFNQTTGITTLEKQGDAVPTKKEGLQKCALISLDRWGGDDGYDMMLLDRQSSRIQGTADYFQISFLGAVPALDDNLRWLLFESHVKKAINRAVAQDQITAEEGLQLHDKIPDALNQSHIDVRQWIQDLPVNEEARTKMEEAVVTKLTDLDFSPPPEAREKSKTEFQGDNNLLIRIPSEFREEIKVKPPVEPEDEFYVITIKTRKWKPK